jgi:hypothetical protein
MIWLSSLCWILPCLVRDLVRASLRAPRALAQRVFQVDGDAVLPEQIGERFVGQFLDRRHAVAPQLGQLVERVLVEGDQFPHDPAWLLRAEQMETQYHQV